MVLSSLTRVAALSVACQGLTISHVPHKSPLANLKQKVLVDTGVEKAVKDTPAYKKFQDTGAEALWEDTEYEKYYKQEILREKQLKDRSGKPLKMGEKDLGTAAKVEEAAPWYVLVAPFCLFRILLRDDIMRRISEIKYWAGYIPGFWSYDYYMWRLAVWIGRAADCKIGLLHPEALIGLIIFSLLMVAVMLVNYFVMKFIKKLCFDRALEGYKNPKAWHTEKCKYGWTPEFTGKFFAAFSTRTLVYGMAVGNLYTLIHYLQWYANVIRPFTAGLLISIFLAADIIRTLYFCRRYYIQAENMKKEKGKNSNVTAWSWTYFILLLLC